MAVTVTHTKVSTIPDDADTSLIRPSDWNATHTLTGVGTMATQDANAVAITGGTITGVSGLVTSVTGTSPVVSSGGTTPAISMPAATTSVNGYLTSTDWTTFNNKGSGTITSVSGTAPVVSSGGATPAISMAAATTSVNGYLTSTDWTTFNNKGSGSVTSVAATVPSVLSISGSPITTSGTLAITYSGTALPVLNGGTGVTTSTGTTNVVLSGSPTIVTPVIAQINDANGNAELKFSAIASAVNQITIENAATGNPVHISATGTDTSIGIHLAPKGASGYINVQGGVDSTKRFMFNPDGGTTSTRTMLSTSQTVDRTLTLPDATDTLVGKATTDTLTNKSISGSTNTFTNIPLGTAVTGNLAVTNLNSGTNASASTFWRGDGTWVAGNAGTITSVTGTAPVVSSGGTTPAISMAAATTSVNGYLTSTDWNTFNGKGSGTVTSVAALTLGTTGTDLSSTVATGTTTPVITLQVPTASASNRGALSAADWTTFNNKGSGTVTSVAASVPSFLSVSGSPITTSGTLALTYSGTALPVANGGTGLTTTPTNGQIDIGNGTNFTRAAITGTANQLTVTNGSGSITLSLPSTITFSGNIVDFSGNTGAINLASGTTAQRPASPVVGAQRWNTTTSSVEIYTGATNTWQPFTLGSYSYTVTYLTVAGGGGGGTGRNSSNIGGGGGGGAGGYLTSTTTFNVGTVYTVTVGAGGAGGVGSSSNSTAGSNSSITGLTASVGGGLGGNYDGTVAGSGGSGGGGTYSTTTAGSGTSGQGFAGGAGSTSSTAYGNGGGGGSSAVGGAGSGVAAGIGGAGTASSITGSSITYAGGGGGGSGITAIAGGVGGTGGGGQGGSGTTAGIAGTVNTGSGGGGGGNQSIGGSTSSNGGGGGSGVVILSVPTASYSGTSTGSPTITTSGSNTILKFTASGSYTG